jgi:rsbT antagonist protein RsbS
MEPKRLPIINLWDRILVPMQGDVTDDLAEQLNTEVLRAIHESGAKGLVIDLTGVWIMDSHLCAVLSNLAAAARLMGTPTILSGLSPEIAMTLQAMGVELAAIKTALTLEQALTLLGLEVRRAEDMEADDGVQQREGAPEGSPAVAAAKRPSPPPSGSVAPRARGRSAPPVELDRPGKPRVRGRGW